MLLENLTDLASLSDEDRAMDVTGLTADSRAVQPGYIFAALKGARADGVSFIPAALEKGAIAVLVDERRVDDDLRALVGGVTLLAVPEARKALAEMAARFAREQPENMVAVTGTSGKTSVTVFVRQIFEYAGKHAASLGTIGTVTSTGQSYGGLTTPDPVSLHQDLARLAQDGIAYAAMEASSHGLDQYRLAGVKLKAAGFTNLGRDHMDYHPTVEDYLQAKLRLFRELLPEDSVVVVDPEVEYGDRVLACAKERGLATFTIGFNGEGLRLLSITPDGFHQVLKIEAAGRVYTIRLPLAGDFQVSNALLAAGLAISAGIDVEIALHALEGLQGAPGRIEHVGTKANGALVFVDYAHKPDALETVLKALRPFTKGRLISLFGCGGDRDTGKRPLMGEISARLADVSIVTDDNPRSEDPAVIRADVMAACPGGIEIGGRDEAIRKAVEMLAEGDVLCVAGKGHETGQIIGSETLPFSDHDEVEKALATSADLAPTQELDIEVELLEEDLNVPLWSCDDFLAAVDGKLHRAMMSDVIGISIDSRTIQPGEAFFAIKGENFDGHDFADKALENGAAVAVVDERHAPEASASGCYVVVDDVLRALERLGVAARERTNARIVAVTGSVGKTGSKEALRLALSRSGETHAPVASFNNHWGVPLTLARMPKTTEFGIFEIGMNHPGEITPLVKMVRPHVAIITTVEPVHLAAFGSVEGIARAKAEIFTGLEPGGVAILNRDNRQYDLLRYLASVAGVKNIVSFGQMSGAQAVARNVAVQADCTCLTADILGQEITYKIGAPGLHYVTNSLGVLAAVSLLGGDLALAGLALAEMSAPKGRGEQTMLHLSSGTALLVDESYNANPASMRAAINLLGQLPVKRPGRRIAVVGDMLELGENSAQLHAELVECFASDKVDLVYCVGTHMKSLWERLPDDLRGGYSEDSAGLKKPLTAHIRPHDIIMIKGSLGTKMGVLVNMLKKKFPETAEAYEA